MSPDVREVRAEWTERPDRWADGAWVEDLGAEMRSRVPRPTRIVKNSAGERDEIGVAGADDRFGLLKFRNKAHRDDWNLGGRFHGAHEPHLAPRKVDHR